MTRPLKPKMWVLAALGFEHPKTRELIVADRVCILYQPRNPDAPQELHEVHPETGETVAAHPIAGATMRQALLKEIPTVRRPTAEVGAALGYL